MLKKTLYFSLLLIPFLTQAGTAAKIYWSNKNTEEVNNKYSIEIYPQESPMPGHGLRIGYRDPKVEISPELFQEKSETFSFLISPALPVQMQKALVEQHGDYDLEIKLIKKDGKDAGYTIMLHEHPQ